MKGIVLEDAPTPEISVVVGASSNVIPLVHAMHLGSLLRFQTAHNLIPAPGLTTRASRPLAKRSGS
jgi:hypothetical protein